MQSNSNKHHVIVGLGLTGLSCARYLQREKIPFMVVDTRSAPPALAEFRNEFPDVVFEAGDLNSITLSNADTLVMSPGVDLRSPAVQKAIANGVKISGDIDLFAKVNKAPLVAITGSNAKSTVVTLLGEMAHKAGKNVAVAGNIGTPVLDFLAEPLKDLYVLELSSFQLETTSKLNAEVATVLNMSPDHMDRYASMQDYHKAKHRVFQGCKQVVINRDDALSRPLLHASVKVSSFGVGKDESREFGVVLIDRKYWLAFAQKPLLEVAALKIAGQHNIANALAALALGHAVGLDWDNMLAALREFSGLPHRCQWIKTIAGVRWYNDSKGTNVGASVAAITGLGIMGRIILLAGGAGKGAEFGELGPVMARYGKLAVVYGEDAHKIAQVLQKVVPVVTAQSLQEAVEQAHKLAQEGDLVLLSPACASFDMFKNYEHRGEVFSAAVRNLH